jgi:hypothetical protein
MNLSQCGIAGRNPTLWVRSCRAGRSPSRQLRAKLGSRHDATSKFKLVERSISLV